MISSKWQEGIVVRDIITNSCLISSIANRLYPDLPFAEQREERVLMIPEMKRLSDICQKNVEALSVELAQWRVIEDASSGSAADE